MVAARYLLGFGYRPKVILTHSPEELSPDSRTNFEWFRRLPFARWGVWGKASVSDWFEGNPTVIDTLLGTGAKGEPRPPYDELIGAANRHANWSLGVDIASGVDSDTGEVTGDAVGCRSTITFGLPMAGHFRGEGIDYTGTLSIADIGFPREVIDRVEGVAELVTQEWARARLPRYPRTVHKADRGKVLIIAGSARMLGAAILSGRAVLKTGAGLITIAVPRSLNATLKNAIPEAMTLPVEETDGGEISADSLDDLLSFAGSVDAVGVGPGLGRSEGVRTVVRSLVEKADCPMVVDADGLFALSDDTGRDLLAHRRAPTVLTPHAGEFVRLADRCSMRDLESDPWKAAGDLARVLSSTVLLKGPATVIATPDSPLFINRTGHPAMSQGGMGDVLTGVIATFLGEGMEPREAAALGAYVHGRAGEWGHREHGSRTVTAGEAIDSLANVFRDMG